MLILDDRSTWPEHIIDQLNTDAVIQLCKSHEFMEHIVDQPRLVDIFADVDSFARDHGLAGYHCTKQAESSLFQSTGLRTLDIAEHHAWFRELIREHPDVDKELYQHIDAQLTYWQKNHTGKREGMIWFCLTRTLVLVSGTESFFKYFGGEAVYFAFMHDERVAPILEKIGVPVVVEAKINVADLTVFRQWAFGRTLVSHFAHSQNPDFFIEELEGYASSWIPPESVIAVHSHEQFVTSLAAGVA
ncbi:MAG: hypothetical protein KDA86_02480 [Planctomycetaceae bacterium]|nr:hypothetical protein [Planctomycetaceae bacterium]